MYDLEKIMQIPKELVNFAQKIEQVYEACPQIDSLVIKHGQKEIVKPFERKIVAMFEAIFLYKPSADESTETTSKKIDSLTKLVSEALTEAALNSKVITLEENNSGPYYKTTSREAEIVLDCAFNRGEVLQNMNSYIEHNLTNEFNFNTKLQEIKQITKMNDVVEVDNFNKVRKNKM